MIVGGDFSLYDPVLDWEHHTWKYAFIKVSEGTVEDRMFQSQWSSAKGYVYRGGYHFFRPLVSWKLAAEKYMSLMKRDGLGELPPVLDFEVTNSVPNDKICQYGLEWLRFVHRESGQRPIVYTSPGFSNTISMFRYPDFADYPLWEAVYPWDLIVAPWTEEMRRQRIQDVITGAYPYKFPVAARPWQDVGRGCTFAQFTGKCPPDLVPGYPLGIKFAVDVNAYKNELHDLIQQFNLPPLGKGEEVMATYIWKRVNSSVGLKIRSGPGTSFAQIGAMTNQDVVEVVSLPQSGWYRIVQWYKGTTKQTLPSPQTSCWAHGDYLVNATIPAGATPTTETTEPAPVAKVVKQVAHFDDGTTVETFPDA